MSNRHADWLRQAEADLRHARNALEDGDHEWACFAAQQAAEKAVKSVIQGLGGEAWGHSVTVLVGALAERVDVFEGMGDAARRLDKPYIPTPVSQRIRPGCADRLLHRRRGPGSHPRRGVDPGVLPWCAGLIPSVSATPSASTPTTCASDGPRYPESTGTGRGSPARPPPSSDVDLCLVVDADERTPRDRVPDYLPARFPVGVDLVVVTEEEMTELADRAPSWHRAIVDGQEL